MINQMGFEMFKEVSAVFAAVLLSAGLAFAVTGNPPLPGIGPNMPDGVWLNGLAAGQNFAYQYGLKAAGTTQATATQLVAGSHLYELDTVASSAGAALPACIQGNVLFILNNGANTVTIYPQINNNLAISTPAQDVINVSGSLAATSTTILSGASLGFFCGKTGTWSGH